MKGMMRNFGRKFLGRNFNIAKEVNLPLYTRPLEEGLYPVIKSKEIPDHIIKPPYATMEKKKQPKADFSKPIKIHDKESIQRLKEAARCAAEVISLTEKAIVGATPEDIDHIAYSEMIKRDAYPSSLNFRGFPKSVSMSVNEVAAHGIPDSRPFMKGDYVKIDCMCYKGGVHGDTALMVLLDAHPDVKELVEFTRKAVFKAISVCVPGIPFRAIGDVIEDCCEETPYYICDALCGHGVGEELHMSPMVYPFTNNSIKLMEPGMVFTIEPLIFMQRTTNLLQWKDGWTIYCPRIPAAQWEHTVLITDDGCQVITMRDGEQVPDLQGLIIKPHNW